METFFILIQVGAIILVADFVGGIIHWALDTFGDQRTPMWGVLVEPFEAHHKNPKAIGQGPASQVNLRAVFGTLILALITWLLGWLNWQTATFLVILGSINHLHRCLHLPSASVPSLLRLGQKIGLLQTAGQHWHHHSGKNARAYCVLTPWLNPILDESGFWRRLERLLKPVFGLARHQRLGKEA